MSSAIKPVQVLRGRWSLNTEVQTQHTLCPLAAAALTQVGPEPCGPHAVGALPPTPRICADSVASVRRTHPLKKCLCHGAGHFRTKSVL